MKTTTNDIRQAYIEVLDNKPDSYFMDERRPSEHIADIMITAIKRDIGHVDWLKNNPALTEACRKVGISKSSELKQIIKGGKASEVRQNE